MNALIGTYSLMLAVLVAAGTMLAALAAARLESASLLRTARWGMGLFGVVMTTASGALVAALLQSDFRLAYVASYTERALPFGYKLAAFWAGQEGSLLFWGWVLALLGVVLVISRRKDSGTEAAVALMAYMAVCGFFAALMLFAANPFTPAPTVARDGGGLNPMLQHLAMVAHPPTLFVGYAGFTVPFALMVGALVAGKMDSAWVTAARRWILVSWLFLTVGIVLGSWWAYLELGWGGYWAWDPVENASLLPWLTGTALLHSVMVQQHRSMFKVWNAVLAALTFILCIFGTYLTRSGIIDSVHAFPKSLIGQFFLFFLIGSILFSVGLILARLRMLRYQRPLEGLLSREGAVLAGNVLLVVMTGLTLVGTIFPVLSGVVAGRPITVNQDFYNKAVLPFALLLMGVMAVAPVLGYGRADARTLRRQLLAPALLGMHAGIFTWLGGARSIWAAMSAAVVVMALSSIVIDFFRHLIARVRDSRENPLKAALNLIDGNHRRYGGHLVHVGMAMVIAGVAGSSLFNVKKDVQLAAGQSAQLGRYTMTFNGMEEIRGVNYTAVEAKVTVTDGSGNQRVLKPQRRFYDKSERPSAEIAYLTNWREDLYMNLAGWDAQRTTIQAIVNPLVLWIWIGGIVLTVGGLFCVLPRFVPAASAEPVVESKPRQRAFVNN